MSKVLSFHTFLMGGEMYGTMDEDEDQVKYLQRSTKKRSTKKSKKVSRDVLHAYKFTYEIWGLKLHNLQNAI